MRVTVQSSERLFVDDRLEAGCTSSPRATAHARPRSMAAWCRQPLAARSALNRLYALCQTAAEHLSMFDLRYHVASLAAVFLALIIGILVGVGISDRGSSTARRRSPRRTRWRASSTGSTDARRSRPTGPRAAAAQTFINETYPALAATG
jgi:hypothetical protein